MLEALSRRFEYLSRSNNGQRLGKGNLNIDKLGLKEYSIKPQERKEGERKTEHS